MSVFVKWWTRLAAAVGGAVLALVVPVHAWAASNGVADVAIAARRYPRRGGGILGFVGLLCCLFVIGAVVVVVVLVTRRRRK